MDDVHRKESNLGIAGQVFCIGLFSSGDIFIIYTSNTVFASIIYLLYIEQWILGRDTPTVEVDGLDVVVFTRGSAESVPI